MTKQKKGFLVFISSLIPGAGELYMGFRKQGMSIMLIFWGCFALGAYSGLDVLALLTIPLWFYSFFNVHNLKSLSEEDFYAVEDSCILHLEQFAADYDEAARKYRKPIAILLLFFGISVLCSSLRNGLAWALPSGVGEIVRGILYSMPTLVLAIAIILAGLYLLNNKKQELDKENSDKAETKEEHYWAPYRPYQQSQTSEANTETHPASPATEVPDSPIPEPTPEAETAATSESAVSENLPPVSETKEEVPL